MRRELRLSAILRAGGEVLDERGFAACTMREVATRAGVSPATLYRYVQGREELLYLVQERILERAIRSAEAARARRGSQVQLRTFVADHIRRVMAYPAEARLLEEGSRHLPTPLARRIDEKRRDYEDLACDLVEGAAGARGVRRATSLLRTRMLMGMADRLGRAAAAEDRPPQPARLARSVVDVFLHGVGA